MSSIDITRLKASWTKFSAVQVVDIISDYELNEYLIGNKHTDTPILKAFLGINSLEDKLPDYWYKINDFPKQRRLFFLIASLFTHHQIIKNFAHKYSKKNMKGTFKVEGGKMGTNIRQVLIRSGAALEKYSRADEVPYDFSPLFDSGEVGVLIKNLFKDRLLKIGYTKEQLDTTGKIIKIAEKHSFHKALSLTKEHFAKWLNGNRILVEDIYNFSQLKIYNKLPLLKVNQWLSDWDDIDFSEDLRRKPEPFFYIFSIDARLLKRLSDVHRRKPNQPRAADISVQRGKNDDRVREISKYIEGGFPWSTLSETEQRKSENENLKMPGFLPTAIIANILRTGDKRSSGELAEEDQIRIIDKDKFFPQLIIPDRVFEESWNPDLKPIEIIDGQHRLWSFDENEPISGNYELPVVVFDNLDRAWQAYLFYTINVKPVKINTSLGYDLYPLLRTQEWLERSKEGALAYRETRAQEIVEVLWLYPASPWFQRINMIGETGGARMSQAAFIRALTNSFLKSKNSLFGSEIVKSQVLDWNRIQQAAFLILLWDIIVETIKNCEEDWAISLRSEERQLSILEEDSDPAFYGKFSFLSRDQGVRGISLFANDFFYVIAQYNELEFNDFVWEEELSDNALEPELIDIALQQFKKNKKLINTMELLAKAISKVDWRTPSATFDRDEDKDRQLRYKGSSGYRDFWRAILSAFQSLNDSDTTTYLNQVERMG